MENRINNRFQPKLKFPFLIEVGKSHSALYQFHLLQENSAFSNSFILAGYNCFYSPSEKNINVIFLRNVN